jgi:quercetin dioxygenase-like cupin family protein
LLDEYEQVRILRCTFPPGVGHGRHSHSTGDFGYVLSGGKMQVTNAKGTEVVEDRVGDHWVSGPIEWHEAVNVGDTTLSYPNRRDEGLTPKVSSGGNAKTSRVHGTRFIAGATSAAVKRH